MGCSPCVWVCKPPHGLQTLQRRISIINIITTIIIVVINIFIFIIINIIKIKNTIIFLLNIIIFLIINITNIIINKFVKYIINIEKNNRFDLNGKIKNCCCCCCRHY